MGKARLPLALSCTALNAGTAVAVVAGGDLQIAPKAGRAARRPGKKGFEEAFDSPTGTEERAGANAEREKWKEIKREAAARSVLKTHGRQVTPRCQRKRYLLKMSFHAAGTIRRDCGTEKKKDKERKNQGRQQHSRGARDPSAEPRDSSTKGQRRDATGRANGLGTLSGRHKSPPWLARRRSVVAEGLDAFLCGCENHPTTRPPFTRPAVVRCAPLREVVRDNEKYTAVTRPVDREVSLWSRGQRKRPSLAHCEDSAHRTNGAAEDHGPGLRGGHRSCLRKSRFSEVFLLRSGTRDR